MSKPGVFPLNQKEKFIKEAEKLIPKNSKDIVLEEKWRAYSILMTESLRDIYW